MRKYESIELYGQEDCLYWESVAFNMPANLENSAVATGLEKVSFHSNPKERQCQRMLTTAQLHSSHMLAK